MKVNYLDLVAPPSTSPFPRQDIGDLFVAYMYYKANISKKSFSNVFPV
jgi:hypothetical protein